MTADADAAAALRERLRTSTREAHARVDRAFLRFDLSRRDGVAAFLGVHARVLPPLEAALEVAGAEALLPDWADRRRSVALAQDLESLGEPWPEPMPAPVFAGDAEILGGLYVLEGSRLGGAVLARRIARSDDAAARQAVRYLAHGEHRRFWPTFVPVLNGDSAALARPDRVEAAALVAFATFEAALDEAD